MTETATKCKLSIVDADRREELVKGVPAVRYTEPVREQETLFLAVPSEAMPGIHLGRLYFVEIDEKEIAPVLFERKRMTEAGRVEVVLQVVGYPISR